MPLAFGRISLSSGFPSLAVRTALWTANLILVAIVIVGFFVSDAGYDWLIFREAGRRIFEGGLYAWEGIYAWSYSPLLAYLFAAIAPLGYAGWSLLHVAAAVSVGDRRLALVTLASWPFWVDLYNGNTMTFVFVAANWAIRGNGIGTASYLLLCLLMPRPVMAPVAIWLLWKQPRWRLPFLAMIAVAGVLTLATGYGSAWLEALRGLPDAVAAASRDVGPAMVLGQWWLLIGGMLALILLARGTPGWASLAASPYWLPQYLLMLLLELVPRTEHGSDAPRRGPAANASRASSVEAIPTGRQTDAES